MEWIIALIVLMIMPLGMIFWWIPWQGAAQRSVVLVCEPAALCPRNPMPASPKHWPLSLAASQLVPRRATAVRS